MSRLILFDANKFNFKSLFNEDIKRTDDIRRNDIILNIISKVFLGEYITFRILSCQVGNVSKVDLLCLSPSL